MKHNIKTNYYRRFYEKETNKKVPSDFDIHHIDFNRKNNNIKNLVAIPKLLHSDYHVKYNQVINNIDILCKLKDSLFIPFYSTTNIPMVVPFYGDLKIEDIHSLNSLACVISNWSIYRDMLLGHINIQTFINFTYSY